MIQAAMILMGEDPKKSLRFFLELIPGKGFRFKVSKPIDLLELEALINKKLMDMEKNYKVSIKKISSKPEEIFQAVCSKTF
jgi:hypothetical protein